MSSRSVWHLRDSTTQTLPFSPSDFVYSEQVDATQLLILFVLLWILIITNNSYYFVFDSHDGDRSHVANLLITSKKVLENPDPSLAISSSSHYMVPLFFLLDKPTLIFSSLTMVPSGDHLLSGNDFGCLNPTCQVKLRKLKRLGER